MNKLYLMRNINKTLTHYLELNHGGKNTVYAMEGIRGVAVFLVFLVHYSSLIEPFTTGTSVVIQNFLHSIGNIGVDLFFVLSGYLIYGSIMKSTSFNFKQYALRRLKRIYPTYLVVLTVYIILSFIFTSQSKLPNNIVESVIYIIANILLLPGIFDITPIVTVSWSLSYELFYYIVIPIVVFSLKLKKWNFKFRLAFWANLGLIIVLLFDGGLARLVMFVGGIFVYELENKKIHLQNFGTTAFLLALLSAALSYILSFSGLVLYVFLFSYFCLVSFNSESFSSRWLSIYPLRWLGNMSYSYYLFHGLALKFCFLLLAKILPSSFLSNTLYYWLWIPFFILTILVSLVLYVCVENPLSLKRAS